MTLYRLIKMLSKERGITQVEISEHIGTTPPGISSIFKKGNPRTSTMVEMLSIFDYNLVFQPKTAGTRKAGVYPLEGGYKE